MFLGRAAASGFEYKFLTAMAVPPPAPRLGRGRSRETVYPKQIDAIIKRNVFCSTCPPIVDKTTEVATDTQTKFEPQQTSLPLQLLAINFAPPPWGFQHSSVVLRDTETKETGAFRAGEKVKGATITGIDEARMHLDNAGKPEFLDLLDRDPRPPRPPPRRPRPWPAATPSTGRRRPVAGAGPGHQEDRRAHLRDPARARSSRCWAT